MQVRLLIAVILLVGALVVGLTSACGPLGAKPTATPVLNPTLPQIPFPTPLADAPKRTPTSPPTATVPDATQVAFDRMNELRLRYGFATSLPLTPTPVVTATPPLVVAASPIPVKWDWASVDECVKDVGAQTTALRHTSPDAFDYYFRWSISTGGTALRKACQDDYLKTTQQLSPEVVRILEALKTTDDIQDARDESFRANEVLRRWLGCRPFEC